MNYPKAQLYVGEGETGGGRRTAGGPGGEQTKARTVISFIKIVYYACVYIPKKITKKLSI